MTGNVVLIGGGPGADDLITIRGLDRLLAADVVIHDRLAPTGLLTRLGRDVEVIDAARAPGKCTLAYDEIVALMIDRARAGKTVVRLKGGDPFVFAHGGQELISCSEAGCRKRACQLRHARRKRGIVVSHGRSDGHGGQRGKAPRAVSEQRRQIVRGRCRCGQGH